MLRIVGHGADWAITWGYAHYWMTLFGPMSCFDRAEAPAE